MVCVAGPLRLIHIHRKLKPQNSIFSPQIVQALQERGFNVPFAGENSSASINARQVFTEATSRRSLDDEEALISVAPLQAVDLSVVVQEVGISVLVERSELVRLLIRQVGFEVNYPDRSEAEHQDEDERLYRHRSNLLSLMQQTRPTLRRWQQRGGWVRSCTDDE